MGDIDTAVVDSLKALDPKWPIREADISSPLGECPLLAPLAGRLVFLRVRFNRGFSEVDVNLVRGRDGHADS